MPQTDNDRWLLENSILLPKSEPDRRRVREWAARKYDNDLQRMFDRCVFESKPEKSKPVEAPEM